MGIRRSLRPCEGSSPIFGYWTYGDADMKERLKLPYHGPSLFLELTAGEKMEFMATSMRDQKYPKCELSRYETMHVERSQGLIMFRALFWSVLISCWLGKLSYLDSDMGTRSIFPFSSIKECWDSSITLGSVFWSDGPRLSVTTWSRLNDVLY